MAAAIEAEHLFCAHGWKHIVRDACFQVAEAEIAVIVESTALENHTAVHDRRNSVCRARTDLPFLVTIDGQA